jgi:hypothetical protein
MRCNRSRPATSACTSTASRTIPPQWGVYSWDGPQKPSSAWITDRFMFTSTDGFGGYVDIPLAAGKSAIWFLVTDGTGFKNCGNDQHADLNADVATKGQEVWMLEGDCTVYNSQPALSYGNLASAKRALAVRHHAGLAGRAGIRRQL